ncbi:hypothetical protein HDZ31DRAFT_69059 [Schizophyllum fasciatum]
MLAVQPPADAPSLRPQKSLNLSLQRLGRFNKSEKSLPRLPGAGESASTANEGRRSHRDAAVPPVPSLPPSTSQSPTPARRISATLRSGSRTEPEPEDPHAVSRRNAALRERGLLPNDLSTREKELDVVSPIVPSPDADDSEVSQAQLIELAWRARQAEQAEAPASPERLPSPTDDASSLERSLSNEWEGGSPGSSAGHSDMSHAAPSLTHTVSSYAPSDTLESPLDDAFRTVAHRIPAAINEYDVLEEYATKPPLPPRKTRTSSPPSAYTPPPPTRATPLSSSKAPPSSFARHAGTTQPPSTRQKLLSSTSLSNLRRSVVGSLSRAQRAVRGEEPRRRTGSLGSQAEWSSAIGFSPPSAGTATQHNRGGAPAGEGAVPARRPSVASRRSGRGGVPESSAAPRVAVNPSMHTHATVMDNAAAIEDEESRKVTEAAFCY